MSISLLGATEIRKLADELALIPSKGLGQNFVHDSNICEKIVRLADIGADDLVIEVGPGLGSLSLSIVKKGAKLIAIEIDKRLADRLPKTLIEHGVDQESFTVIAKDAMEIKRAELTTLGGESRPLKLVANLPYNVSVPVLLHFLEMEIFSDALVMVQSEVAQRLAAPPGSKEYGVPSAKVAWYADARLSDSIPRTVFWPIPRIDSSLLRLTMHQPLENETLRRSTFAIIDAAFNQRRKMLRSSLSPMLKELVPDSSPERVLESSGIDPTSRAESLSVDQFLTIARTIETLRNSL
ncbi:MAG: 16S rRNA (adenine(1518)-N(6)/adenine(1519)-N(6))-dimethyltransferase RsmA [Candidatus Nanopelagicaceae bacterium]